MRYVLIGLGVLAILLLGVVFVVPTLVPSETYRTRIQEQLSAELGRDVVVSGDVRLSTFPAIRARTGAVRVANPDGFAQPDLATLQGLDAKIRLLPLLSRRVEIKSFTLREPVITLERRADGAVNWSFGDEDETASTEPAGPFRRDGRYTNLDPAISAFNIENGTVRYIDRVADTDVTFDRIDTFLSLPGLDSTLVVDGSLRAEGRPLTLDIAMTSPDAFLSGGEATLEGAVETAGATLTLDGAFPAGEALAFRGEVDGEVTDMAGLRQSLGRLLPDQPAFDLLQTATLSGTVDYAGDVIAIEGGRIGVAGPALEASFAGDARYDGTPLLDGTLDADIKDAQALRPLLPEPVAGFELLRTASLSARLDAQGTDAFTIGDARVEAAGQGFTASFEGSGRFDEALSLIGPFDVTVTEPGAIARAVVPDAKGVGALGRLTAKGQLKLDGGDVAVTALNASTTGGTITGTFTGEAGMAGDTARATGRFDADIPDMAALLAAAQLELDPALSRDAAALGAVEATGQLAYDGTAVAVSDLDVTTQSAVQQARYTGRLRYAETVALDGRFDATVPDLAALDAALSADIPYGDAITRITASGTVSGSADDITVSDLSAAMSDGLINGQYQGSARVAGDELRLDGQMSVGGDSLRRIAALQGTVLPPSTPGRPVFERFGLQGKVGGTAEAIRLDQARLTLDGMTGNGAFAVDLSGAKPRLSGTLDVGDIDLRPYMDAYSAQRPDGEIQPWSEEPLPVEPLRAVDADLDLRASSVKISRLELGPTTMDVQLRDGRLSGDLPALALYGGKGRASFAYDASQAVPRVELDAALNSLDNQGFLSALAGFAKATGTAGTTVSLSGSGRSQADIMRSLSGAGDYKVLNGELQGIDAGQFLSGLDTALRSRALPSGIGPGQTTKFRDLLGAFNIKDGVASVDRFSLDALGVSAEGSGQVDLGRQTIDFRFRPKATGENARGLAAFGVPIRFSGGFGSAKAGLDTEFLGDVIAARARAEASRALTDRVGGPVGDILGGVLGGGTSGATPAEGDAPATRPSDTRPTDRVGGVLGGLLGGGQSKPPAAPAPTEPTPAPAEPAQPQGDGAAPESVEDAVLGLFGVKRRKAEPEAKPEPAPQD